MSLHLSAIEWSTDVEPWIRSWWPVENEELQFLSPHGWFCEGHSTGSFVWTPPPAAARPALDVLSTARHKRPSCMHIVVIPRLFTVLWRKFLGKLADLVFTLPCGHPCWPKSQHEPLIVALCFPLIPYRPFALRNCSQVPAIEGELRRMFARGTWGDGDCLRQLCQWARALGSMPEDVVRRMLRYPSVGPLPG